MKLLQPYDLKTVSIDSLLYDKKILLANDNKSWQSTLFPESTPLNVLPHYDKDRIITKIDDVLFDGFTILTKPSQTVYLENGTKRDFIKSIEIGDFEDSVKRYTQLDKPIDYNTDAQAFLNLPNQDFSQASNLNIDDSLIYKSDVNVIMTPNTKPNMYTGNVKHPHINTYTHEDKYSKYNNKAIIEQIFRWAKEKGVKYIYCINEYRANVINNQYVMPYVYYTIKGAYEKVNTIFDGVPAGATSGDLGAPNIIDEFNNDIVSEDDIELIY